MRVHCYEHPNEPMERCTFAFIGTENVSIILKCKVCNYKIEVVLNKNILLERGFENL